jgi:archaellum component FlaC
MKMFEKKGSMVTVERDIYEAMIREFQNVKAERNRNKQLTDKLKKDLSLLDRELSKIGAKIFELTNSTLAVEEAVRGITERSIKDKLVKRTGYVIYMTDGMQGRVHKLREIMEMIKRDVKPWDDIYKTERMLMDEEL